jgi:hypothetical protein
MTQEEARKKAWEQTGIISFHNAGIESVPSTAWKVGPAVRVLDLGGNVLQKLPPLLGHLTNLQVRLLDEMLSCNLSRLCNEFE